MRQGPELVRASNAYAQEDRALTWRLLLSSLALYLAVVAAIVLVPWPWLRAALAFPAGLLIVRLFIFYHDYLHGAVLTASPAGKGLMTVLGLWVLTPPTVWKATHDYHHQHTAKMMGGAIGSYPVVTVEMWKAMTPGQRRSYRLVRHPLNMLLGYLTVFAVGMCLVPFFTAPRRHWDGLVSVALHFGVLISVGLFVDWGTALLAIALPQAVACAVGAYLFYAQHNFPSMEVRDRRQWEYSFAALRSSSMMDMPGWLHWFTGNIGYHHVHHLNHRIPFYRLPEAMAGMEELQNPGRTSFRPADVLACLRLALWDTRAGRMIRFAEAARAE